MKWSSSLNTEGMENRPGYIAERALLGFSRSVCAAMEERGISKSKLAELAELHPAQITRVLSCDHNVTVRTAAKIASALRVRLILEIRARQEDISVASVAKFSYDPSTQGNVRWEGAVHDFPVPSAA